MKARISKYSRQAVLIIADIICVYSAVFVALMLRFEWTIPLHLHRTAAIHGIFISAIFLIMFFIFRLYESLWEYVGLKEVLLIGSACIAGTVIVTVIELLLPARLPLSAIIIAGLISIIFVGGVRIAYRGLRAVSKGRYINIRLRKRAARRRIMVVGAGDASSIILREMLSNPLAESQPVVVVDDDKNKQGKRIHGVRIEGGCDRIPGLVKKYDVYEIIFAMPSADKKSRKRILKVCFKTRCRLRMMPSVSKMLDYNNISDSIREVRVEDLLGRNEIDLNVGSIASYIKEKTILITGGGGSIGSEIARQVVKFEPKKLVVLDMYENGAYELMSEFKIKYSRAVEVDVVIGSIRDIKRLEDIFSKYKPDVVFHAAAHKHVPLIEANPGEAVKNNVLGTFNTAKTADKYGVRKFVLISTDKAVNPTNVMGATKRIAEMIVQSMDKHSETEFTAVRFGNVLGSNGSVIPLFKKQIEAGGPVTLTHPDIKRYFMTIPEASKLVIQAGAMARGGEIFILDMGELIKIKDLAKALIKLSGLTPDKDIEIKIIGLRPGEKLFEELMLDEEKIRRTLHDKIFIEKSLDISYEEVKDSVGLLADCMDDTESLREVMARVVPGYTYEEEVAKKNGKKIRVKG